MLGTEPALPVRGSVRSGRVDEAFPWRQFVESVDPRDADRTRFTADGGLISDWRSGATTRSTPTVSRSQFDVIVNSGRRLDARGRHLLLRFTRSDAQRGDRRIASRFQTLRLTAKGHLKTNAPSRENVRGRLERAVWEDRRMFDVFARFRHPCAGRFAGPAAVTIPDLAFFRYSTRSPRHHARRPKPADRGGSRATASMERSETPDRRRSLRNGRRRA